MGGNYEKSIYNQLMDVMARLESVEKKYEEKIAGIEQDYKQTSGGKKTDAKGRECMSQGHNKQ